MTSSKIEDLEHDLDEVIEHNIELQLLVSMAAPLIATAAFKGGSLYYKAWVDKARGLGFEIVDPTTHPAQEGEGTHGELE